MSVRPYSPTNPEGYPEVPKRLADQIFAKAATKKHADPVNLNAPDLDAFVLVTIGGVIYKVLIPFAQICRIDPRGEPGEACWVWALSTPEQDKAIRKATGVASA